MNNPWAFGWAQPLTIIGFAITLLIAVGGFRSFERWRREKVEEMRIGAAIDALVLIREARWVFENIRSPMVFSYEWDGMPQKAGENEDARGVRGSFYAVLKRVENHKEFFERAWKMQIKCGALFGQNAEDALLLLQKARREVEVSAEMLARDPDTQNPTDENKRTWNKFRADVWGSSYAEVYGIRDTVGEKLDECSKQIEATCRPAMDREYGKRKRTGLWRVVNWLGL